NKALDFPINTPRNYTSADPKAQPALTQVGLFLRPLRGVKSVLALDKEKREEAPAKSGPVELYRYEGPPGYNLFVAADTGALKAWDFQQRTLNALQQYANRLYGRSPPVPSLDSLKDVTKQAPKTRTENPAPIPFKALTIDEPETLQDGSRYLVFFHQAEEKQ